MSLLDGGQRRELIAPLQIDSLLQQDSQYYLKKLIEKRSRGNTHEVTFLDVWLSFSSLEERKGDSLGKEWSQGRRSDDPMDHGAFETCKTGCSHEQNEGSPEKIQFLSPNDQIGS